MELTLAQLNEAGAELFAGLLHLEETRPAGEGGLEWIVLRFAAFRNR